MATRKGSAIPDQVIDKFLQDIAGFTPTPAIFPDPSIIGPAPTIRIVAEDVPAFAAPHGLAKKVQTLKMGTKARYIGSHNDFVGFEFNAKPVWTNMGNVELGAGLATALGGLQGKRTIIVARDGAPIFPQPRASKKKARTLNAGTELPFIGVYKDFIGFEHDNKAFWTRTDNVDLSPNVNAELGLFNWRWPGSRSGAAATRGFLSGAKDYLIRRAFELRNEYRDNPFVSIKGFTIEFSVPPGISIDFEFKD